jgi:hypothetical protein
VGGGSCGRHADAGARVGADGGGAALSLCTWRRAPGRSDAGCATGFVQPAGDCCNEIMYTALALLIGGHIENDSKISDTHGCHICMASCCSIASPGAKALTELTLDARIRQSWTTGAETHTVFGRVLDLCRTGEVLALHAMDDRPSASAGQEQAPYAATTKP